MNNNNSLTALVTVATGFLGKHLCQKLTVRIPGLYACDAAKSRKELGYQTREFDSTLKDTISLLQAEEII